MNASPKQYSDQKKVVSGGIFRDRVILFCFVGIVARISSKEKQLKSFPPVLLKWVFHSEKLAGSVQLAFPLKFLLRGQLAAAQLATFSRMCP